MIRFVFLAATLLALVACGDNADPAQDPDTKLDARGEVLGGSISDDMLPLDTVTSQSPPLVEETASDRDAEGQTAAPASNPDEGDGPVDASPAEDATGPQSDEPEGTE